MRYIRSPNEDHHIEHNDLHSQRQYISVLERSIYIYVGARDAMRRIFQQSINYRVIEDHHDRICTKDVGDLYFVDQNAKRVRNVQVCL